MPHRLLQVVHPPCYKASMGIRHEMGVSWEGSLRQGGKVSLRRCRGCRLPIRQRTAVVVHLADRWHPDCYWERYPRPRSW